MFGRFQNQKSASGEITLESIAAPEGIVLATEGGTVWTPYTLATDRLGSVRAIVDMSSGTVVERDDYYPYGKRITSPSTAAGSYPQLVTNRWRFSGKEEQDTLALTPYLDFGARQYDPEIASWLAPDPLATDYPGLSPYVYCAADPGNLVDPEGKSPIYDPKGNFLGTDQYGLSGRWIVLNPALFYQGMLHVDASNLSVRPESKEAWDMISAHFNNLPSRPDYDGYVTAIEGIRWAKNHPNALKSPTPDNTLYIDASKLDFGILSTTDFPEEGESYPQNLFNAFNVFWANNNPVLFDTVYALGRFDAVLIDRHERTIRIVNHGEATNYDWNTGGGRIRNTFIKVNNFLFNINPEIHGVKVYYYGKGRLHH